MQDDAPVAEFVAEPLDHQRGIGWDGRRRVALLVDQLPQVVGGEGIESNFLTTRFERRSVEPGEFAVECADRGTQLGRPADTVATPERQPCRLAGAGITSTRSWVISVIRQLVAPSEMTSPGRDS